MLYLLDASVLITAHNTYYGLQRVPEFWTWLLHHGRAGRLKIPAEIYAEVEDGSDELADWAKSDANRAVLVLEEESNIAHVQQVLSCYGAPLLEEDLITIGKDPFLVAAALPNPPKRVIVTAEVSKPARHGPRRHVPNVCGDCGVTSIAPIAFLQALNFSTGWNP
jgi:hypothetical protein